MAAWSWVFVVCALVLAGASPALANVEIGVLRTRGPLASLYSVAVAEFSASLPSSSSGQDFSFAVASPEDACSDVTASSGSIAGSIVLARRGNCSFVDKATNVIQAGGHALVVINTEDTIIGMSGELPEGVDAVPVVMMGLTDGNEVVDHVSSALTGALFQPARSWTSLIFLWVMAVGTVVGGSLWAAPSTGPQPQRSRAPPVDDEGHGDEVVEVTANAAIGFVVMASLSLVLLFYFMKNLIIVIIVIFCLGSMSAMYQCFYSLCLSFSFSRNGVFSTAFPVPCFGMCSVLSLVVSAVSIAIGVWFFVCRHASYSWVLQDVMGICMCFLFLKTFRFPNVKISALLLSLAFLYDIFWVFISPVFFGGKSVMVAVATGGGTNEAIPMLIKFPNFCEACSPSLLGLGDIVLPGLFVSFTLSFDRVKALRYTSGYFLYNAIGYGIGLILTYIALMVMEQGQPALLYLVPCTLGTTVMLALYRGDASELWHGVDKGDFEDISNVGDQVSLANPLSQV